MEAKNIMLTWAFGPFLLLPHEFFPKMWMLF